jgi:uncharacterized membrane protein YhhN
MIGATIVCAWSCIVLLVAEARGIVKLRVAAKTSASLAFVMVGLYAQDGSLFGRWILGGLALGAVGDVCLLGAGKRWFMAGLATFLGCHVAYIVAIGHVAPITDWLGALAVPALIAASLALAWLRPHLGRMTAPVTIYVAVITAMVIGALATRRTSLALGAVLFFASDLAVARQRFVGRSLANKLWGLPAYYAGQLLIAWSI